MTTTLFLILVPLVLLLAFWRKRPHEAWDEPDLDPEAIVSGIVCNECGNTLPPHMVKDHFNVEHPIHACPHKLA